MYVLKLTFLLLCFPAGTCTDAELVQCALLNQLVLPLLQAAQEAGKAAELLSSGMLDVFNTVFRLSDGHTAMFGELTKVLTCSVTGVDLVLQGSCAALFLICTLRSG